MKVVIPHTPFTPKKNAKDVELHQSPALPVCSWRSSCLWRRDGACILDGHYTLLLLRSL